jgi:hypothetical protein
MGQEEHCVDPIPSVTFPKLQNEQNVDPFMSEYFPLPHKKQTEDEDEFEKLPGGQNGQKVEDKTLEKLPAGHDEQDAEVKLKKEPIGQLNCTLNLITSTYEPLKPFAPPNNRTKLELRVDPSRNGKNR